TAAVLMRRADLNFIIPPPCLPEGESSSTSSPPIHRLRPAAQVRTHALLSPKRPVRELRHCCLPPKPFRARTVLAKVLYFGTTFYISISSSPGEVVNRRGIARRFSVAIFA